MNLDQIERMLASPEAVEQKMEQLKQSTLAEMWQDYRKITMPRDLDPEMERVLQAVFMAGTFLVMTKLFAFIFEAKAAGNADRVAEQFEKLMKEANEWAMGRITNALMKGELLEELKRATKRN